MSLTQTIKSGVKAAFTATTALNPSVVFTHYDYSAAGETDHYSGAKTATTSTQTIKAIVGKIESEIVDGNTFYRTSIYVDDDVLTLALSPDDIAAFNGDTWRIESLGETSPQFLREIRLRRP